MVVLVIVLALGALALSAMKWGADSAAAERDDLRARPRLTA